MGAAAVVAIGMFAQWVGWRLHVPSILFLLVFGVIAGPLTGVVVPGEILGPALFPFVSLSVAVILFEGGLSLKLKDLREVGGAIRNLIVIGVPATWVMCTAAAHLLLGFDLALSLLFGALLVITGPTVIMPILRHLRPSGRVEALSKWEGIVNDPIGVILAVLVFEAIAAGGGGSGTAVVVWGLIKTVFLAVLLGVGGGLLMEKMFKNYWIPDFLHNLLSLTMVVAVYVVANAVQRESGLLAVTLMGFYFANQESVDIQHIMEFKENLRVLLISVLFIILAARLSPEDVKHINASSLLFLAVLIVLIRPLSVMISTLGSNLCWRERLFLSLLAPRGIVAAATSSVFALALMDMGMGMAERLLAVTFLVIVGTVTFYGLIISPVARLLGLADPDPQGVLFVGAHDWARRMAKVLHDEGFYVMLVDSNWMHVTAAMGEGLRARHGNVLSPLLADEIELSKIGKLFAVTSNDEVNSLAALHFSDVLDRSEVYQLSPAAGGDGGSDIAVPRRLRGRILFDLSLTYARLSRLFEAGGTIEKLTVEEGFSMDEFAASATATIVPLFLLRPGQLLVFTADMKPTARQGSVLVYLKVSASEGV